MDFSYSTAICLFIETISRRTPRRIVGPPHHLGLVLTGSGKPYGKSNGPNNALGFHTKRCKRSAMFVDNGVVKVMQIAEAPDDPAGDDRPEVSCIENMLSLISKL